MTQDIGTHSIAIERTLNVGQGNCMLIAARNALFTVSLTGSLFCAFVVAFVAQVAFATEPFHYSAVLRNGKKVGDLVPGISTLEGVIRMFPAAKENYPGNPRPPIGYPEVKIGKVQPEPATVFNPPGTSYALFFDDNDKLVIVEDARSPLAGLGPQAVHKRFPALKDTGHDERVIELQGQLDSCIVMMVLFSAQTRKVTRVAYAYTCPTGNSETTLRAESSHRS